MTCSILFDENVNRTLLEKLKENLLTAEAGSQEILFVMTSRESGSVTEKMDNKEPTGSASEISQLPVKFAISGLVFTWFTVMTIVVWSYAPNWSCT